MEEANVIPKKLKSAIVFLTTNEAILCFMLFFIPETFIENSGWKAFDPFAFKLVAAGLFALDLELFRKRNSSIEILKVLLNIKVVTMTLAAIGCLISMNSTNYETITAEWVLLFGTTVPAFQWIYWRLQLNK